MRIGDWNKVAMLRHIWILSQTNRQSIWTSWMNTYLLKGKCFWEVVILNSCSWAWRHILKLRSKIIHLIRSVVGNGKLTFFMV
ncbi:hypothetical protein Patl1_23752 [Pistacia atlantica]|uniref:Uncharacterized protein n=1 Tax=Pistacia atlantica TaxID=434234 RepID=A0ACC0ZYM3_9ROSI|nr:hypothetical protein Patl1_23752 [Pistacia atlantica]